MIEFNTLNNFGFVKEKLPQELFSKLKTECEEIKSSNKQEFISGLTGNGVAKHYPLEQNKKELDGYAVNMFNQYDSYFNVTNASQLNSKKLEVVNGSTWVNLQNKHEFIPNHFHSGIAAYVVWVNIPYEHKIENPNGGTAGTFQFVYQSIIGTPLIDSIKFTKEMEGTMIMFPASLIHCVYPFYTSDDVRISIAGNILFDSGI